MTPPRVRVLIVDDSAFARKVMREVLSADPRIEIVGIARDGLDALEKIAETKPDVVTLDLVMPELDGLGVLDALRELPNAPRVIGVSMSAAAGVAALQAGAFDIVHKPTALATDRLYELGAELVQSVILAAVAPAGAHAPQPPASMRPGSAARVIARATRTKIVVLGASTGGPRAITHVLRSLPASLPVPVAVVVHMPPGYTDAFAMRLNRECAVEVLEAEDGMLLTAGRVAIARAGIHMKLRAEGDGWAVLFDAQPIDSLHRPSVDALFSSAAREIGAGVLGVVLTGMGSDGLEGARAICSVNGRVLVEDESTCVVYGMPRAVAEEGLAEAKVSLQEMGAAILARL
jgi:two-component system chemotaxis response regulator CheB